MPFSSKFDHYVYNSFQIGFFIILVVLSIPFLYQSYYTVISNSHYISITKFHTFTDEEDGRQKLVIGKQLKYTPFNVTIKWVVRNNINDEVLCNVESDTTFYKSDDIIYDLALFFKDCDVSLFKDKTLYLNASFTYNLPYNVEKVVSVKSYPFKYHVKS